MRFLILLSVSVMSLGCGEVSPSQNDKPSEKAKKEPVQPSVRQTDSSLAGSWVLSALPRSTTPFIKLYPRQHPIIYIQPELSMISGSTGCNRFSATLTTSGNQISMTELTQSTLTCVGEAESIFLNALKNSTRYRFRDPDELVWSSADSVIWMVFQRR